MHDQSALFSGAGEEKSFTPSKPEEVISFTCGWKFYGIFGSLTWSKRVALSPRKSANEICIVQLYVRKTISSKVHLLCSSGQRSLRIPRMPFAKSPRCIPWLSLSDIIDGNFTWDIFGIEQRPDFEKTLVKYQDAPLIH